MVTKVIVERLQPKLYEVVSMEQFGFMSNRHILDAIGVTQECLHTTKTKNLISIVMKIDLDKAYDKVNWDFLRLVLLQIGLHVEVTNWIMGCVSSASFFVLINGSPTKIFVE